MIIHNPEEGEELCLAFQDKNIILRKDGQAMTFHDLQHLQKEMRCYDIISEPEYHITALDTPQAPREGGMYYAEKIRLHTWNLNDEALSLRIWRAKALLSWRKNTKFCTRCGGRLTEYRPPLKTNILPNGGLGGYLTAMECEHCHTIVFPRIEPCIIVLVHKGDEILLASHAQRDQKMWACIAGFMEVGETAEQCVAREIYEETGLRVKNIRYMGSQSWPFPSQLMLAFYADYESGEIKVQEEELKDARWFHKDNLPNHPAPGSIAYRLIHNLF